MLWGGGVISRATMDTTHAAIEPMPASTDPRKARFKARFGIEPSHAVHWAWIDYFYGPASICGRGLRAHVLDLQMELWFIHGDDLR
jgi:hypothetical protein